MLRNALITSYRTIVNNKTYTIINVTGLVLGLTAAFVLLVFAINEISYNHGFTRSERIYRIILTDSKGNRSPSGSAFVKGILLKNVPEIKTSARIVHGMHFPSAVKAGKGNRIKEAQNFISADKELFSLLDISFSSGGIPAGNENSSIIYLSETAAGNLSPDIRLKPSDTILLQTGKQKYPMKIAGIFRDLPWNSTIKADYITDLSFFEHMLSLEMPEMLALHNSMDGFTVETLCEIEAGTNTLDLTRDLARMLKKDDRWRKQKTVLSFQSFYNIYLGSSDLQNNAHAAGNRISVYTYSWLAVFILLLAGINYAILSTARSALRFKEIGVRKVLGATKKELRMQILTESVLLTFMALPLALFFMGLIDPRITGIPDYTVTMYSNNMLTYIVLFALVTLVIGILSGLYVAIYLAGLNPINALKAKFASPGKFNLSKVFIGFQLFITLSLLISVITIYSQIRLCYISNLSVSGREILLVSMKNQDFKKYFALKKELRKIDGISRFSGISFSEIPSAAVSSVKTNVPSSKDPIQMEWINIDNDFFSTLGIPIIQGRDFDTSSIARNEIECIFNDEAVSAFQLKKPVGAIANYARIVGVVQNFNIHTLHNKIIATNFFYNPYGIRTLVIRFVPGKEKQVISSVKQAWEKVVPKIPFTYSFYQSSLATAYQKENNFVVAVTIFTLLAFIITGMGLFGLALLIAERKTKETAIRKVFGASNTQIIFRMQKEFLIYTGIATVFALPVSWLIMELWLKEFYYRVNVSLLTMFLSVLTVSVFVSAILLFRTLKVLRANPINALKYE